MTGAAATAALAVDARNGLGEGVVWDDRSRRLLWTDIEGSALWWHDPAAGETGTIAMPERVGSFALRERGGLLVAFASGFAFYDVATGRRTPLGGVPADPPGVRLNDGRCDRQGRFVAGGFDEQGGRPIASVYRVDPDGAVEILLTGLTCTNSLCFSPDGRTMYLADTPRGEIWACDYDPATGRPVERRVFARLEAPGAPDGSTVDAEGFLWNAEWQGRRVVRYAPDGTVDRVVEVPTLNPTCVAFGGPDLDVLYVTTARYLMTPDQLASDDAAGGLFAVRPGVRGLPEVRFAG